MFVCVCAFLFPVCHAFIKNATLSSEQNSGKVIAGSILAVIFELNWIFFYNWGSPILSDDSSLPRKDNKLCKHLNRSASTCTCPFVLIAQQACRMHKTVGTTSANLLIASCFIYRIISSAVSGRAWSQEIRRGKYLAGTWGHISPWPGMLWWITWGIVVETEMVCLHDKTMF